MVIDSKYIMKTFNLFLSLLFASTCLGQVDIFSEKIATTLNKVTLYPDSTFIRHSNISYPEGELLTIIGQSRFEHEDDAQNQKFYWYKVTTQDGKEGWMFGDGIAVILPDELVTPVLQDLHKKEFSFNNGFEKAVLWIASTEGRDNFHTQDYLNPLYKEYYLVITNRRKRSVHISVAGLSARGEYNLHQLLLRDVTGDQVPDFILEKNNQLADKEIVSKTLEVYTFKAGNIAKVLDEPLDLDVPIGLNLPPLYKFIEVDNQTIRVEFLDYKDCKGKSLTEQCIDFVTYTYTWNERLKKYESFYGETRIVPEAKIVLNGTFLLRTPVPNANSNIYVHPDNVLKILRQINNPKGTYYLVKTPTGKKGYLYAKDVQFSNFQYGKALQEFYLNKQIDSGKSTYVKVLEKEEKM